jgi:hypothetical protein
MDTFDSDKWLEDRRYELVNLMFNRELGIPNFKESTTVLNFDDLQSHALIDRFDHYRKALRAFFGADEIRSLLDYYYLDKDKKPLLNLIKQILKHYGYHLHRVSEYQGNFGGTKVYKSRYTIVRNDPKIDPKTESTSPSINEDDESEHRVVL